MEDLASNEAASSAIAEVADALIADAQKSSGPDLYALAAEATKKAHGDLDEATDMLLQTLRSRFMTYYMDMQAKAVRAMGREIIRRAAREIRDSIARNDGKARMPALGAASMLAVARGWMDWPVAAGVPLRDATRATLAEAAHKYLSDAKVYTARGSWLDAIAKKLKDDKTPVSKVLDEAAVATLAKKFGVVKE